MVPLEQIRYVSSLVFQNWFNLFRWLLNSKVLEQLIGLARVAQLKVA